MNEIGQNQFGQLRAFIEGNSNLLQAGGPAVTCARQLGEALASAGLKSFSRQDYDGAYSSVLAQGGTIKQAQDVAGSMTRGSVDAFMTGKELYWLSTVLPAAANGDWGPYLNTATEHRAQVRQVLPLILSMPDTGELMPIVRQTMAQFEPMVEEQIVMASCLFWK